MTSTSPNTKTVSLLIDAEGTVWATDRDELGAYASAQVDRDALQDILGNFEVTRGDDEHTADPEDLAAITFGWAVFDFDTNEVVLDLDIEVVKRNPKAGAFITGWPYLTALRFVEMKPRR